MEQKSRSMIYQSKTIEFYAFQKTSRKDEIAILTFNNAQKDILSVTELFRSRRRWTKIIFTKLHDSCIMKADNKSSLLALYMFDYFNGLYIRCSPHNSELQTLSINQSKNLKERIDLGVSSVMKNIRKV